jgi:hypothetical protein
MHAQDDEDAGRPLVGIRTMEIVVALVLLAGSAIVIFDSVRLGFGWQEGMGPAPGYFPFYIAVALGAASLVNLMRALGGAGRGSTFVGRRAFGRVLQVLVPSIVYVGLIGYVGIYVASALFLCAFMLVFGREGLLRATAVSIAVPLALFFMFEKWFLVPLPKGPLEAMLGY